MSNRHVLFLFPVSVVLYKIEPYSLTFCMGSSNLFWSLLGKLMKLKLKEDCWNFKLRDKIPIVYLRSFSQWKITSVFQTPGTPSTPLTPSRRVLRSTSTPNTTDNVQKEVSTPLKASFTPNTPNQRSTRSQSSATKPEEKQPVFRTPMSFKPRMLGNKVVPSPSRNEIWKQQLGFTGKK